LLDAGGSNGFSLLEAKGEREKEKIQKKKLQWLKWATGVAGTGVGRREGNRSFRDWIEGMLRHGCVLWTQKRIERVEKMNRLGWREGRRRKKVGFGGVFVCGGARGRRQSLENELPNCFLFGVLIDLSWCFGLCWMGFPEFHEFGQISVVCCEGHLGF
jgi:hypothetical protein